MNRDLELELVDKARSGDPSAGPFLVSCFGERLLGFARAHAPDLSDADREQIVEMAIEAGVRAIGQFDPAKGTLVGWFRGQIRFKTLAWRRRVPGPAALPDDLPTPGSGMEPEASTADALRRAIAQLAQDDQMMLALRGAEQLVFAEIGQRLDITEAAARQRYHRALARLRTTAANEPALQRYTEGGER